MHLANSGNGRGGNNYKKRQNSDLRNENKNGLSLSPPPSNMGNLGNLDAACFLKHQHLLRCTKQKYAALRCLNWERELCSQE